MPLNMAFTVLIFSKLTAA